MHHVHDLNAGGRNTIEHYVVWVRDDLMQARHAIADVVQGRDALTVATHRRAGVPTDVRLHSHRTDRCSL